jgi:uncharacterized protein YebE (UPF0316 family)
MDYSLFIYFFVGIVQDMFFTLNVRYVAKEKIFLSVFVSFMTVLISTLVLYNIIARMSGEKSIIAIIIYSLGIATGTYLGMKFKIKSKN